MGVERQSGLEVAVAPEDAPRAREILAEDRSAELEHIDESRLPPADEERCPACDVADSTQATRIAVTEPGKWLESFLFVLSVGLLQARRRVVVPRSCRACGHTWENVRHR